MGLSFWHDTQSGFFRQRDDGDWDFFPSIGRGYRVNAEQRERIITALRHYESLSTVVFMLAFALGTLGGADDGSVMRVLEILAICFVALRGYRFIRLRPLWRDLPRTEGPEALRTMPQWQIAYLLASALVFGLFSPFLLWHGVSDGDADTLIIGLICFLAGIGGTWFGIELWRMRRLSKRQGG